MHHSGNIWHIFEILDYLNEPHSQSEITRKVKVSNKNLIDYIFTMKRIELIIPIPNKLSSTRYGSGWMKRWQITSIGREFKETIRKYVEA